LTQDPLDRACARLDEHLPRWLRRTFGWLRSPPAKLVRIPVGILCLLGGMLWFLPLLGIWMLPLGLLLLAQDVRLLRKPVGRGILWLIARYEGLKARFSA